MNQRPDEHIMNHGQHLLKCTLYIEQCQISQRKLSATSAKHSAKFGINTLCRGQILFSVQLITSNLKVNRQRISRTDAFAKERKKETRKQCLTTRLTTRKDANKSSKL